MKKAISLLVALMLVVTITACGGNQNSSQSTNTPANPSPEITLPGAPGSVNVSTPETPASSTEPSKPADSDEKEYGGVVKMITAADTTYPFGLPWNSGSNNASQVQVPYSETLVFGKTSGALEPYLATDWTVDIEKGEVLLKLREDVFFSDGSKFNAAVVEWNFDKSIETRALNPVASGISKIEARSEYEVAVIMMDGFTNMALPLLFSRTFGFASKENYDKVGDTVAGEIPVGTGPYVLKEKVPGVKVVYEANKNYWQPDKPYLDLFEFHVITDVMTQTASMLSKGPDAIDVLNQTNSEQIMTLREDPDLTIITYPNSVVTMYPSSKNEGSPLAKKEVREAISLALNREAIAEAKGFGILEPAKQMIARGYYGWFDDGRNYYPYDQSRAKDLLSQAGYPNGFKTTLYCPGSIDRDIAVAVQEMLRLIGIEADMEFPESGLVTELRTVSGWEGLMLGTFLSASSAPTTYRIQLDPTYQYYISTWRPVEEMMPDYDMMRRTPAFDVGIFQSLHSIMAENMIIIPILTSNTTYIVRNCVRDAEFGFWGLGTVFRIENMWRASN